MEKVYHSTTYYRGEPRFSSTRAESKRRAEITAYREAKLTIMVFYADWCRDCSQPFNIEEQEKVAKEAVKEMKFVVVEPGHDCPCPECKSSNF